MPENLLLGGWIQLFDGQTLYGWQLTGDAKWQVVDGEIRADLGAPGFLITTNRFADYELSLEFRAPADTNSGVFLRTLREPSDPTKDCYELNIAPPDNPFPTGSIVARKRSEQFSPPSHGGSKSLWHELVVHAEGGRIRARIDGTDTLDYTDPKPIQLGRIGLQFKEGPIAFRNIRLRPLGLKPMFNGKDLAGWTAADADQSRFDVTEAGEIKVLNGPGQLETESRYANFLMQLECFVAGNELNSGIFFRSIPGDRQMGYESQIHNGFLNGDRGQIANGGTGGTGGIFRRQDARRIVAEDRKWFTKTILADGPHMAVWVNGYQVSDWTDDRPPHPNPRQGQRLEAGTIIIQGHDPTTNLRFRNLRIVELPD